MHPVASPIPRATLVRQVRTLIHQRKRVEMRRLHLNTDLGRELGFDTVDVVDVILAVERRFHLTIPDEVPLETVGDFVRYVGTHWTPAAAA